MTMCVFVGPTLSWRDAAAVFDVECCPPAALGDVYRAAQRGVAAIGIIDGSFDGTPAVWHKEILWALANGIAVYGAGSMGALRAAELDAFGMVGVGSVFAAFRDGVLHDDDEVVVAHRDASHDYRPSSAAMVNVRATLNAAVAADVISHAAAAALVTIAKTLYYPARTYPSILERARADGVGHDAIDRLQAWLPHGCIDVKRDDALAMLARMRDEAAVNHVSRVTFHFEHTVYWQRFLESTAFDGVGLQADLSTPTMPDVIDELGMNPSRFVRVWNGAMVRYAALREAARRGVSPSADMIEWSAEQFRRGRDLVDEAAFHAWLDRNGLTAAAFRELMAEEVSISLVLPLMRAAVQSHIANHLRMTGEFEALVRRAAEKHSTLMAAGFHDGGSPAPDEEHQALQAYADAIGRTLADQPDTYPIIAELAGRDLATFLQALVREHQYVRLCAAADGDRV